jgi:ABC-type uncharacterized transport system permease subunit
MRKMKVAIAAAVATALLSFAALGAVAAPAHAANQSQRGLVNVQVGDITTGDILSNNNVNVAVAANVAATVCGVTVPVAVLAQQVFRTGGFSCSGATQFVNVTQRP